MKILFLVPYPQGESPSQRFRFEQYFKELDKRNIHYRVQSFWSLSAWKILYLRGHYFQKAIALLGGFLKRVKILFSLHSYHFIFIHRECTPIGPPIFEWLIANVFRKKIIYDFDDSIWIPNTSEENKIATLLKWHSKVKSICRWSYRISCGNLYLADFAKQFNKNVQINPTTIDTTYLHNPDLIDKKSVPDQVVLGWTGTHSTLKYLDEIIPILQKVYQEFPSFKFLVIANKPPAFDLPFLEFTKWSKSSEIEDLLKMDIGLMPLTDDAWAKGKCGFKALQYMALKIPAVASPVGVNQIIIDHGTNGMICASATGWEAALVALLKNSQLRKQMGENARRKVINHYSLDSNLPDFLSLFD